MELQSWSNVYRAFAFTNLSLFRNLLSLDIGEVGVDQLLAATS